MTVCLPPLTPHAVPLSLAHLGVQQVDPLAAVQELLLSQPPGAVVLLQQGPQLLHLGRQQTVAALGHGHLLLQLLVVVEGFIQLQLDVLEIPSQTCD